MSVNASVTPSDWNHRYYEQVNMIILDLPPGTRLSLHNHINKTGKDI
jgi:hypothetical protein